MQTLSTSPDTWSNALMAMVGQTPARNLFGARKPPEACGWFDSSFDLAKGLEITEEDNDMMYQLWEISRR